MKQVYKRLQGAEWHNFKDQLDLIRLRGNKNGNIKGFYKDVDGHVYSHWLNDVEKQELFLKYTLNQIRSFMGLKSIIKEVNHESKI